jgi:hypothetical protein
VINFSEKVKDEALAAGKYQGFPFRYQGELRNYGPMLVRYWHLPVTLQMILTRSCTGMGRGEIQKTGSIPDPMPDMASLPRRLEEVLRMWCHATPRGLRGRFEARLLAIRSRVDAPLPADLVEWAPHRL